MHYIKEILQKNKFTMLAHVLTGICLAFLTCFKADFFQDVIDSLTAGTLTPGSVVIYGILLFSCYLLGYLEEWPWKKLENGIYLDFKLMALKKISSIDYSAYCRLGTGKPVQRIENGAAAGRNVIVNFWLRLIRELVPSVLFSIFFIWRINRTITYVLLIGYLFVFLITNLLLKFLYRIKEKILNNEEQLNHYLVRGFMEMLVFRTHRQFPGELRKADRARREIVSTKVKMNMIHESFFTIFAILVGLLEIIIVVYAWKTGSLSVGSVVALITLIGNAYTPIAIFNVIYVQYKLDKTACGRLVEFLEGTDDPQLEEGRQTELKGGITVKNLSFRYEERQILDGLSLTVRPGEKVAFVGESGCGKSTLAKLLMGLLKYESGSILLDGTELKELCLNDLYGKVSYLSQDAPVFDGTLRENLIFDRDIPDDALEEGLRRVQLTQLLHTAPAGMDTQIGERDTLLSGGEKQRLALARLWFEDPRIVILDEATSAMDNLTEECVMEEVVRKLEGRTVIAIAHRLKSVAGFDRILVFREGRIVAQGTFDALLKENAYFADLYHASAAGNVR